VNGEGRAPLSLVLCGGGITGAMYEFGALHALDHLLSGSRRVTDFDFYVGTSAGAIVAALMANGVPPGEVGRAILRNTDGPLNFRQEDIVQLDWRDLRAAFGRVVRLLPRLVRMRRGPAGLSLARAMHAVEEAMPSGIYTLDNYRAYLRRLLTSPGCTDAFADLRRELFIPAVHLDTGDRVIFGGPGWRDVSISDAIAASSALPLYFRPVTLRNLDFVDGGVGQVVHLDQALERGSRFVILINPVLPIRNEEGLVCIPTLAGHCARIQEKGVSFVIDQSQRISARHRLMLGIERVGHLYPDARIVLIEPPARDSVLFLENILNYGTRVSMLQYGYLSTAALLRARFDALRDDFATAGLSVSLAGLREDDPWGP
jgi:predicted acylesterase/phospholipase RssA